MAILIHGTTRKRAETIVREGPDPNFREPGRHSNEPAGLRVESFSTYLKSGPFIADPPEEYARRKVFLFPDEGGPVILEIDVPDDIVELATDEGGGRPLSQGIVQFDEGSGIEELRAAWPNLAKRIVPIEDK